MKDSLFGDRNERIVFRREDASAMKRAALVVAVLCMATSSVAQSPKDQGVTEKTVSYTHLPVAQFVRLPQADTEQ